MKSKCSYYYSFIYTFVYFCRVGCHGSRIARLNGMYVTCITLNLYMASGSMSILTLLILAVGEHGYLCICLCLQFL